MLICICRTCGYPAGGLTARGFLRGSHGDFKKRLMWSQILCLRVYLRRFVVLCSLFLFTKRRSLKNNLSQSFAHCIQYLIMIQQYIFLTLENLGKENYNEMKRKR